MRQSKTALLIAATTCAVLLGGANAVVSRFAATHLVSMKTMTEALAQGPGCVLVVGDSRTACLFEHDPKLFSSLLKTHGANECVANLSVPAGHLGTQVTLARHYLEQNIRPRSIIVGFAGTNLVPDAKADRPDEFYGNNAAGLLWSRPSDVYRYFPDFPWTSLDGGMRFLLGRTNSLSIFASLAWRHVQDLQDRILSKPFEAGNQYGTYHDMSDLAEEYAREDVVKLQKYRTGRHAWELAPWFQTLTRLAHRNNLEITLVELPLIDSYRRLVGDSQIMNEYRNFLHGYASHHEFKYINLAHQPWLNDHLFIDGLHLTPEGSRLLLTDLAKQISANNRTPSGNY